MQDEKLIECVRKYEFLYNLQHPKYMDNVKKEITWKEISGQLKQPAPACKQRWQGLRDAYRRAVNKRKGKSGQAAKNTKKWKYEEEMSFVASFLVERKKIESVELSTDDEESQNSDVAINPDNEKKHSTDAASKNTTLTEIQNEDDTVVLNKFPEHRQAKKAKTINMASPLQSASAVLMSRLLDTQNIPQQREHDELDRFFFFISETVKKFTPYTQAVAKNKIFSLVSEMELQQLAPPSFTTTTPRYACTPSPASSCSSVQSATPMAASTETCNTDTNDWQNIPLKNDFEEV